MIILSSSLDLAAFVVYSQYDILEKNVFPAIASYSIIFVVVW